MDIAKYAGLYFQRSEYLYLPGLGNLEIQRKAASYNSEQETVQAPESLILFKPSLGVMDDSFANFVANNERVSLAAATNAISDFSRWAKEEIANGNQVAIPGVGSFSRIDDQVHFEIDANFTYTPKTIPAFKNVAHTNEYKKDKDIKEIIANTTFKEPTSVDEIEIDKGKINYGKLFTIILIGLALLGGISYIVYYAFSSKTGTSNTNRTQTEQTITGGDLDVEQPTQDADNSNNEDQNSTEAENASNTTMGNSGEVAIIVNEYENETLAENRVKKLKSFAYNAEYISKDNIFLVIIHLPASPNGAQFVADSIKPVLNPKFNVRPLN